MRKIAIYSLAMALLAGCSSTALAQRRGGGCGPGGCGAGSLQGCGPQGCGMSGMDCGYPQYPFGAPSAHQSGGNNNYLAQGTPAGPINLLLVLPDAADKVWINDVLQVKIGTERRYCSPAVEGGFRYFYRLKVTCKGIEVPERKIAVVPGDDVMNVVDLAKDQKCEPALYRLLVSTNPPAMPSVVASGDPYAGWGPSSIQNRPGGNGGQYTSTIQQFWIAGPDGGGHLNWPGNGR